jgi:hypothetical protein
MVVSFRSVPLHRAQCTTAVNPLIFHRKHCTHISGTSENQPAKLSASTSDPCIRRPPARGLRITRHVNHRPTRALLGLITSRRFAFFISRTVCSCASIYFAETCRLFAKYTSPQQRVYIICIHTGGIIKGRKLPLQNYENVIWAAGCAPATIKLRAEPSRKKFMSPRTNTRVFCDHTD